MPSEYTVPSHKIEASFCFYNQQLQIENNQLECMHWLGRAEEQTKISRPQGGAVLLEWSRHTQGCRNSVFNWCIFNFLGVPSASSHHWLWDQGVKIFQTLQERTLKFVKFISVWKGKKSAWIIFTWAENCFLFTTMQFQIVGLKHIQTHFHGA